MRRASPVIVFTLVVLLGLPLQAEHFRRGHVKVFAVLPEGSSGPEGLEVDSAGNAYVTTFGFTAKGSASGPGQLFVFNPHGELLRQLSISGSSTHLLGLRFHPHTGALLVCDFGAGKLLDVDPLTGAAVVFMTLPALPLPSLGTGLNDVTFDAAGNVYVSDSFQGIVWQTGPHGGVATVWVDDPLLRTTGVPPFGANGLRFNKEETALFVANTGNDTIVKIPVALNTAGKRTAAVFTNSIGGADGVILDDQNNLWVVANQSDEIVVVDPTGRVIEKLGDFAGVNSEGQPVKLLFPASLRFSGKRLLVTNLSLDLRIFSPTFATVDSEWCAQVTRYTVVSIELEREDGDE
jgi:sugar lactone lactonase YvrE